VRTGATPRDVARGLLPARAYPRRADPQSPRRRPAGGIPIRGLGGAADPVARGLCAAIRARARQGRGRKTDCRRGPDHHGVFPEHGRFAHRGWTRDSGGSIWRSFRTEYPGAVIGLCRGAVVRIATRGRARLVLSQDHFVELGGRFAIEQGLDLFTGFLMHCTAMHRVEGGLIFKLNDRRVVASV
jgi:hypothetical protein